MKVQFLPALGGLIFPVQIDAESKGQGSDVLAKLVPLYLSVRGIVKGDQAGIPSIVSHCWRL